MNASAKATATEGEGIMNFIDLQSIRDEKDYLCTAIAYWTAPTISKKKPSTLLSFSHNCRDLYSLWETHKEEIVNKLQLEYIEIRKCHRRVLVIFFDRSLLIKTLLKNKNKKFLCSMGYPNKLILDEYLLILKRRFKVSCPHEVGIFLGIPLEDVICFIKYKGKGCLLNSCYWKVYNNPERAKVIFASYDRAKVDVLSSLTDYSRCLSN